MSNAIAVITEDIYKSEAEFNSRLSDKSISFSQEAGFAIQVLDSNDYALKLAINNRQSVINAVTNIAAIGISLNPAKKQAYLVPRDGKICLDISYIGLSDLATASGSIRWVKAAIVYDTDKFSLNGFDKPPEHQFKPFGKDRGEPVGAYVVVKTADGDYLTEAMSTDEINDIRDRSSAWKAWIEKKKKCPWVTDWGEMAKKTVIKRAYKTWPKTDRLDKAIHHLNTDGEEGLADIRTPTANATSTFDLAGFIAQANAAATEADLTKVYATAMAAALAANDKPGAVTFKNAAMARRAVLREQNTVDMESTQ